MIDYSGDENSISERSSSFSQTISTLGKKNSNESSTSMPSSASSFDLFNSENSEQAKEMIKTSLRQEIKRLRTRAISESGSDEAQTPKAEQRPISPSTTATVPKFESHQRKPTMLLAGPHFRSHTIQSEKDFKRDTIYPVSVRIQDFYIDFNDVLSNRFLLVFYQLFSSFGNLSLH